LATVPLKLVIERNGTVINLVAARNPGEIAGYPIHSLFLLRKKPCPLASSRCAKIDYRAAGYNFIRYAFLVAGSGAIC
jgi:hypothetical protein